MTISEVLFQRYHIYDSAPTGDLPSTYSIVTSDIFTCTTLVISWFEAIDPDSEEDDLTYTIQYSLNGVDWITLTTSATTTDGFGLYVWDVSGLALNTEVEVRVRANDGEIDSEWTDLPYDIIVRDTSTWAECFIEEENPSIRDAYVKQLPINVDNYSDVEVFFKLEDPNGNLQTTTLTFYLNVPRNPAGDVVDVRDGVHLPLDLGDLAVVTILNPTLIDADGDIGVNIALGWHTLKWRAQADISPAQQLNTGAVACITTDDGEGHTDITYVPFVLDTRCPGNQAPALNIIFAGQNIDAYRSSYEGYQECGPDINVLYTLTDPDEDLQTITLEYSIDGGVTYYIATPMYCSGDIGEGVIPATATKVIWNVEAEWAAWDRNDRYQENVWVRVTANDGHGHSVSDVYGPFVIDARGIDITSVTVFDADTSGAITLATTRITIEATFTSYTTFDWVAFEFDINGLDFHRYISDVLMDTRTNNISAGTHTISHTFTLTDYGESLFFIGTYLYYRVSAHSIFCHPASFTDHAEVTREGVYSGDFAVALDLVEGTNIVELVVETATGGYTRVIKNLIYDITPPRFINAFPLALNKFKLAFSENIFEDGCDIINFTVTPSGRQLDWEGDVPTPEVESVVVDTCAETSLVLTLVPILVQGQEYTIGFQAIRDEATNILLSNEATLASFVDNFVFDEAAQGTMDGFNTIFTTSVDFVDRSLQVYWNGQRLDWATDYTKTSSKTFQLLTIAPSATDQLRVAYQKATSTLQDVQFNIYPTSDPSDPGHGFILPSAVFGTSIRVFVNGERLLSSEYTVSGSALRLVVSINPLVDLLVVDYISGATVASMWIMSEIPSGLLNSSNRDFEVTHEVRRGTLEVFYDGDKLQEGVTAVGDFALASNESFLTDMDLVPALGDSLCLDYVLNEEV